MVEYVGFTRDEILDMSLGSLVSTLVRAYFIFFFIS